MCESNFKLAALAAESFHHLHHIVNRKLRSSNPDIPEMPEERNPIFYVYPICIGISLILGILWLCTQVLNRYPILGILGNGMGAVLIITGGISAMRHAEKHINLNEISDEELLAHPIFFHNFTMCLVSILGMIFYLVSMWILLDLYIWEKKKTNRASTSSIIQSSRINVRKYCTCSHGKSRSPRRYSQSRENSLNASSVNRTADSNPSPSRHTNDLQDFENGPIVLYCCCVDCYRYLKAPKQGEDFSHEFQVIQVM